MNMELIYLAAAIGLVQGLKFMGDPARAKLGNTVAAGSVIVALIAVAIAHSNPGTSMISIALLLGLILIGTVIGKVWSDRVAMTAMPQLVSIFNALGGACAVVLGLNAGYSEAPVENNFLAVVLLSLIHI